MTYLQSYKELIVWQKSMSLVKEIYLLSEKFPKAEMYSLSIQMRRASVSIPSNIAEGYGRKSNKEYAQFYSIAYGSALELETQLIIAKELGYADSSTFDKISLSINEILKMLYTLSHKIKTIR